MEVLSILVAEDAPETPRTPEAEATIGNGWSAAAPTGAKSAVKSSSKKAATKQRRDGSGTDRRPKNSGSGTDRRQKGTLQLLPESVREALDHSRKARGNHNGSDTSRSRTRGSPSKHTTAAGSQPLDTSDLLAPPDPVRLALARVAQDTLQASNFQGELLRITAAVRSADDDAKESEAARQLAVARAEAATAERMHAEAVRLHAEKAAEALLAQEELLRDLRASKAESSSAIAGEAAAMAAAAAAQLEAARLLAQVQKLQVEGEQKEDAYAEELQRCARLPIRTAFLSLSSALVCVCLHPPPAAPRTSTRRGPCSSVALSRCVFPRIVAVGSSTSIAPMRSRWRLLCARLSRRRSESASGRRVRPPHGRPSCARRWRSCEESLQLPAVSFRQLRLRQKPALLRLQANA